MITLRVQALSQRARSFACRLISAISKPNALTASRAPRMTVPMATRPKSAGASRRARNSTLTIPMVRSARRSPIIQAALRAMRRSIVTVAPLKLASMSAMAFRRLSEEPIAPRTQAVLRPLDQQRQGEEEPPAQRAARTADPQVVDRSVAPALLVARQAREEVVTLRAGLD